MIKKRGILLSNLGSPDSPTVPDVRKYLNQFLMDPRVIDVPYLLRRFIVSAFVLPSRPKNTAHAYQSIWWEKGSPLLVISEKIQQELRKKNSLPISLGMRYGNPSIEKGIRELLDQGVEEIFLFPLYPHYAMATTETVVVETQRVLSRMKTRVHLKILPPFYDYPRYIEALVESARSYFEKDYDHLLFSFHGLPERHLKKMDPTKEHCLEKENCCDIASSAHKTCYRHQVFETMKAFVKKASIPDHKVSLTFQSRFGRDVWLSPLAEEVIPQLARQGIQKLLVICPGFTADCLETLEEIGIRGKNSFLEAGGKEFQFIPCINDHPLWLETLNQWCLEE